MTDLYPERHSNITLETKSVNYLRGKIPPSWVAYKPDPDYGKDLVIEIEEDGSYKGSELIVQLKSSHIPSGDANFENIQLSIKTYNYLRKNLLVVMLTKYIESEDETYWILLKDVTPPENNQESSPITIKVPRMNKISTINWENDIVAYVREVTRRKLNANIPPL